MMLKTIELDIPKTAAERIAREDKNKLLVGAARLAEIAHPSDPHAQTELMLAIVNLVESGGASGYGNRSDFCLYVYSRVAASGPWTFGAALRRARRASPFVSLSPQASVRPPE